MLYLPFYNTYSQLIKGHLFDDHIKREQQRWEESKKLPRKKKKKIRKEIKASIELYEMLNQPLNLF